jgi:hypothetical protein
VEETTALWLAWREAYVEKGAPLTAPADWHGRWLPEFLRRVGAGGWNIACEGEHKERVSGLYDPSAVDDEAAFENFVAGEVAVRRYGNCPVEEEATMVMDEDTMQAAVESGDARVLGDLPGTPTFYQDAYWTLGDQGWQKIEDDDTIRFLVDAERRLRLADEAVARSEDS